jgi:glutamate 5-kinase
MRVLQNINTLILKIGSSLLTSSNEGINNEYINNIACTVSNIKKKIPNVLIVSSGAVAAGFKILGFKRRPKDIIDKQICAAVGQAKLIWYYEQAFEKYNIKVAQILFTKDDFANRRRFLNARHGISKILKLGIVPIINENDIVVIDELKYVETFGDNDNLSALVSGLIEADMLLMLSDVDGLFDSNPFKNTNARIISEVNSIEKDLKDIDFEDSPTVGTGGMRSKVAAAKKAIKYGCYAGIINGLDVNNIKRFLDGEDVGTFFNISLQRVKLKKFWLANATISKGDIIIDDGAIKAITNLNKSLLPSGVVGVRGKFDIGDIVRIISKNEIEIAKGKARYSSEDIKKIAGINSKEIEKILGFKYSDEVVHKDDLIITLENIIDNAKII